MKNLILLGIILTLSITLGISKPNSPDNKRGPEITLDEAIKDLKECSKLLKQSETIYKQEAKRWTIIHNKPKTDEVKFNYNSEQKELVINIKIDPVIKNQINKQPIIRSYIHPFNPKIKGLLYPMDIVIGPSYTYPDGLRPFMILERGSRLTGQRLTRRRTRRGL